MDAELRGQAQGLGRVPDDPLALMKYPAVVATLIVSALAFGCDVEADPTKNFDDAFHGVADPGSQDPEFSKTEDGSNLRIFLEADAESHVFTDAKFEFSRIELGSCVERDTCATMNWEAFGDAHMLLSDLHGGASRLIDAEQVDLGEYDELRFFVESGYVETEDGWEELRITTQSVSIPLGIELAPERRLDVRVLFDAPASIAYDIDDGWTLDAVLTVENVEESPTL